jgi:hypothetical protein
LRRGGRFGGRGGGEFVRDNILRGDFDGWRLKECPGFRMRDEQRFDFTA